MNKIVVALLLAFAACSKSPSGATETTPPSAALAPAPVSSTDVEPSKLLADASKLAKFVAYQKEIMPHMKAAMELAMGAFARGAKTGEQMGKELSKDERTAALAAAQQTALTKAGLSMQEVTVYTTALTPYITSLGLGKDAFAKNLEIEKKAGTKGPSGIAYEINKKYVEGMQTEREKLRTTYGQAALEVLTKHEAELAELGQAQMEAVLGKK